MSLTPQIHSQPLPLSPALKPVPLKGALRNNSRPGTPAPTSPSLSPSSGLVPLASGPGPTAMSHTSPRISLVPAGYTPKVGFDTFENPNDDALFSFTLQVKSEDYQRNRNTRVYLCAASPDESGKKALEWALESSVEDGDELVVLRGFDAEELENDMHDEVREQAKELMRTIQAKNNEIEEGRKLSIAVEFVAGKVTETIERMIALYRPDSLIVGTRGTSTFMYTWGAALGGMGSVSKYCLSHSPVPVIVVQPDRKVQKTIEKRRADPKRKTQFEELTRGSSGPMLITPSA